MILKFEMFVHGNITLFNLTDLPKVANGANTVNFLIFF